MLIHNALEIFVNSAKYEEIIELFEKDFTGKDFKNIATHLLGPLGIAYFKTGEKNRANMVLNNLLTRNNECARDQVSYSAATIYVTMGEKDKALQCLEKAYSERELNMVNLKADLNFRPLHGDPRYENLLAKMGLK
jgi:tetratricopeptide (TPR) repeat protein